MPRWTGVERSWRTTCKHFHINVDRHMIATTETGWSRATDRHALWFLRPCTRVHIQLSPSTESGVTSAYIVMVMVRPHSKKFNTYLARQTALHAPPLSNQWTEGGANEGWDVGAGRTGHDKRLNGVTYKTYIGMYRWVFPPVCWWHRSQYYTRTLPL